METLAGLGTAAYPVIRSLVDLIKGIVEASETASKVKDAVGGSIERKRARAVYWEVVYNAAALTLGQSLRPPTVLATRHEWDQPHRAGDLASTLKADEVGMVTGAYLELDSYLWFFSRGPLESFRDRLSGDDQKALERLAQSFRDAELILRRHLFNAQEQSKIGVAISASSFMRSPRRGNGERLQSAVSGLPLWAPFIPLTMFYLSRAVSALEKIARAGEKHG